MTAARFDSARLKLFGVITGERAFAAERARSGVPSSAPGEASCDGEWHEVGERKDVRPPSAAPVLVRASVRLAEALAPGGYSRAWDAMAFPVADALEQSIDLSRPLAGLADIPPALDRTSPRWTGAGSARCSTLSPVTRQDARRA